MAVFVAACLVIFVAPQSRAQKGDEAKKGSWEKIKVHGKSLEGNLEGDSPDRDVFVYLPPTYATSPNRRFPSFTSSMATPHMPRPTGNRFPFQARLTRPSRMDLPTK